MGNSHSYEKMHKPFDPAIPHLGINPTDIFSQEYVTSPIIAED